MKPKLYFERGSELCYTKAAILERLKEQGLRQVEVFEAEKESVPGFRWCRYKGDMGATIDNVLRKNKEGMPSLRQFRYTSLAKMMAYLPYSSSIRCRL